MQLHTLSHLRSSRLRLPKWLAPLRGGENEEEIQKIEDI